MSRIIIIATFLFGILLQLGVVKGSLEYKRLCDSVFCRILEKSNNQITSFKKSVDEGSCIPRFGEKADEICNTAIEEFSAEAPLPDEEGENESIYDQKIEELERLVDAPLHVLYLKQLSLIKEKAIKAFRKSLNSEVTEFEAMAQADELFCKDAEECTRQNPEWTYSKEASLLKASFNEIVKRARKITEIKSQAAKQTQQAMQYLQIQQQQLQAIQQQVSGQNSPWNIGAAYRVPDTNINLSFSYQQGRGNLQVSCVPDESVPLLGQNGFVHGVTPGNIGLSLNINI